MKYEMQELDEIVQALDPRLLNLQKNKAAFTGKCEARVYSEVKRIEKQMVQDILVCDHENRRSCYVEQHQRALTKLSDTIYAYLNVAGTHSLFKPRLLKQYSGKYASILTALNGLLEFLMTNFYKSVDKEYQIPLVMKVKYIPIVKKVIAATIKILENHDIDEALAKCLCEPFENFISTTSHVSYNDYEYIQYFIQELNCYLNSPEISVEVLCDFLLVLDFNHPNFFKYYISRLKEENKNTSVTGQTEYYYSRVKEVNQLPKKSVSTYQTNLPGIKDQVVTWMAEEIYFLEKKQQLSYSFPSTKQAPEPTLTKVQTSLSVAHLSLALKVLMDTGVIKHKNATELMRMVATNFSTDKREHISEDSLRNKAYNVESSAVEGLRDVIIGLLNQVGKY